MGTTASNPAKELGLMTTEQRKEVDAFRQAARKVTQEATRSRETAVQFLIDAGIFGKNGKPKKQFR
uniref:Uncharacterized protein n=1 Tax=Acidobacterium capsulatum TaxID=33075 RepID=A0A7V5CTD8_9BACT